MEPSSKPSPSGRGLGEGEASGNALTPALSRGEKERTGESGAPAIARRGDRLAPFLRRPQTDVERTLWFEVRDRRLGGVKFRRKVPLGPYVVDFPCLEARLIVELDGGQHGGPGDAARQDWLERNGYRVLRFWNNDVSGNLEGVLRRIARALG